MIPPHEHDLAPDQRFHAPKAMPDRRTAVARAGAIQRIRAGRPHLHS